MLDCQIRANVPLREQNKTSSPLEKLEAPAFGHVVNEPMSCIEMQNFDAIVVKQARKPMKVDAVADKDRVIFRGDKTVVIFIDDVDPIA